MASSKTLRGRMEKKDKVCVYCGCTEELYLTIDHKVPKAKGGGNTQKNMQWCCILCNQIKGDVTESDFIEVMDSLRVLHRKGLVQLMAVPKVSMDMNRLRKET